MNTPMSCAPQEAYARCVMAHGTRTAAIQLLVLAYADEHRAAEVLATLHRLRTGSLIDAQDVVSVVRALDWGVTLHYGADLRADDEQIGQFWRTLVGSLLLAPGTSTTIVGAEAFGFDTVFASSVREALPPGSSGVFLLVPRTALTRVLPELGRFGGSLLQTAIERAAVSQPHRPPSAQPGGRGGASVWG